MYESLYIGYVYMYIRCKIHKTRKYQTYTGWIRVQTILSIILYFYYKTPDYLSLCFVNNLGCLIGIHTFYALTKYELLNELIKKNVLKYGIRDPCLVLSLSLDFVLHGLPVVLITMLIKREKKIGMMPYIWYHSGILHTTYVYTLTGSWNPCKLYNCKEYPQHLIYIGWLGVLIGHYMANLVLNVCISE